MKIPLLLNLAQCKLSLGEYYAVIEHCTKVLEHHPDTVKALYRRAKAYAGTKNLTEAKQDFEAAMALDSSLVASCKKEIADIEAMEKIKYHFD